MVKKLNNSADEIADSMLRTLSVNAAPQPDKLSHALECLDKAAALFDDIPGMSKFAAHVTNMIEELSKDKQ